MAEFQDRDIRYVLVGGLAVLLHGVDRLTADIDLVVDLAPEQAAKAVDTLLSLGFKANAPVDARQFADAVVRKRWQTESGMLVLSFWDPQNRRPTVDLFADYPMDFELLFKDSLLLALTTTTVRVASLEHLIALKRVAGSSVRPAAFDEAPRGSCNAMTSFGSWQDAEELRKWSFLQRTPQQRLDWLVQGLAIAYQCGALKSPARDDNGSGDANTLGAVSVADGPTAA